MGMPFLPCNGAATEDAAVTGGASICATRETLLQESK